MRSHTVPKLSSDDFTNVSSSNSENLTKFGVRKVSRAVTFPYLFDLIRCEFCHSMRFSEMWSVNPSALFIHVGYVIKLSSWLDVIRVATQWVIARMDQIKPFWNVFFVVGNPGCSVGQSHYKFPSCPSEIYLSVPLVICGCLPFPTSFAFGNFRPKSSLKLLGEYLRQQFRSDRLRLHNSVRLICATLSAVRSARGHFFFNL